VPRPLVERAAAEAQVLRMEAEAGATTDKAARAALAKQIVDLSVRERVLSDETALLVLETDADYARYGLDRKGLADILEVGKDGLELVHRDAPAVIAAPAVPVTAKSETKDTKQKGKLADKAPAYKVDTQNGIDDDVAQKGTGADQDGDDNAELLKKANDESGRDADRLLSEPLGDAGPANGEPVAELKPPTETPAPAPSPEPQAPPPPPAPPASVRVGSSPGGATVTGHGYGAGSSGSGRGAMHGGSPADHDALMQAENTRGGEDVEDDDDLHDALAPWTGDYADIKAAIAKGHAAAALDRARAWHAKSPGDLLGLVALGDALEATNDRAGAARAYGSIIDLFPARADLRRFAGERLEELADRDPAVSRGLALDTYQRAEADRPDHLTGHRLYAYALLRAGRYDEALAAIERGLDQKYPADRFRGADRILREDLGLVGGAWAKSEPAKKADIAARIAKRGGALAVGPSTRFVLYWETDDNDVDFHIRDAHGGHAFYKRMHLRSGGDLYADVTTGYGPEEFAIQGAASAGPYHLQIHYFSRGPMGYGMGTLEIIHRDARGGLSFEHRPFIVMNDKAYVDLGTVAN
jgi:tetratricopeptide (TPR) repeat protein